MRHPEGPGQGEDGRGDDLREAVEGSEGRVRGWVEQDLGDGGGERVPEGSVCSAGGGVRDPEGPGQGEGGRGDDLREAVEGSEGRVRGWAEQDLGDGGREGMPEKRRCTARGGVRDPQGSGQGEGGCGDDLREAVEGAEGRVRGRAQQDL